MDAIAYRTAAILSPPGVKIARNIGTPKACENGSAFPAARAKETIILVDYQWLSPYQYDSADLNEQLAGRLTNAAKAIGARPVAQG